MVMFFGEVRVEPRGVQYDAGERGNKRKYFRCLHLRLPNIVIMQCSIAESTKTRLLLLFYYHIYITNTMATLSASTSRYPREEQQHQQEIPEAVYGDQNGTQEATLEGWRDIA